MKLANLKKVAVGATLATASALTMAEGIADVSSGVTAEIAKVGPVVSEVGVALISVYVLIKAFRLVSSFLRG